VWEEIRAILTDFQFEQPLWLIGLVATPFVAWYARSTLMPRNIDKHIDPDLLQHLVKGDVTTIGKVSSWFHGVSLSLMCVWVLFVLSLAAPQWNFRNIDVYQPGSSLIIVLDMSASMNARDISPDRLGWATREIEDILDYSPNLPIGLVVFAGDSHVITPITDDHMTIRNFLPHLSTDIIFIQGDKVTPAVNMARNMLAKDSSSDKNILIISDGNLDDIGNGIRAVSDAYENGYRVHVMAIGTSTEYKVLSVVQEDVLREFALSGGGVYTLSDYSTDDVEAIIREINNNASVVKRSNDKIMLRSDGFYIFLIISILPMLRHLIRCYSCVIAAMLILGIPKIAYAEEETLWDRYFVSPEIKAYQAFDDKRYDEAIQYFQDPYRRGVALYKAGRYKEAEQAFTESTRSSVKVSSLYNLGNALAQQGIYNEAIDAYKAVLREDEDHQAAQHNIDVINKLMKTQEANGDEEGSGSSGSSANEDEEGSGSSGSSANEDEEGSGSSGSSANGDEEGSGSSGSSANGDEEGSGSSGSSANEDEEGSGSSGSSANGNEEGSGSSGSSANEDEEGSGSSGSSANEDEEGSGSSGSSANGDEEGSGSSGSSANGDEEGSGSSGSSANGDEEGSGSSGSSANGDNSYNNTDSSTHVIDRIPQERSEHDIEFDRWMNQVSGDIKNLLRQRFKVESEQGSEGIRRSRK